MSEEINNMEMLLDRICKITQENDHVSLGDIIEEIGNRSFGPLLLVVGLLLFSPLSGIPGLATTMSLFIILISIQLLLHKKGFWLPRFLLKRSLASSKVVRAMEKVRPAATFLDRWLQPRLTYLICGKSVYSVAIICLLLALGMPFMELIPFSASSAGFVLLLFGLALILCDGLIVLIAYLLLAFTAGSILYGML